jgi:hypothetical protein
MRASSLLSLLLAGVAISAHAAPAGTRKPSQAANTSEESSTSPSVGARPPMAVPRANQTAAANETSGAAGNTTVAMSNSTGPSKARGDRLLRGEGRIGAGWGAPPPAGVLLVPGHAPWHDVMSVLPLPCRRHTNTHANVSTQRSAGVVLPLFWDKAEDESPSGPRVVNYTGTQGPVPPPRPKPRVSGSKATSAANTTSPANATTLPSDGAATQLATAGPKAPAKGECGAWVI